MIGRLLSLGNLHEGEDKCCNQEAVKWQRARDSSEHAIISTAHHVHDCINDSGTCIDEADIHGDLWQKEAADAQDCQQNGQHLDKVLMHSHRMVELHPVSVGQFCGVAALTSIWEASSDWLCAWESRLMLLLELLHELLGENREAGPGHDDHANQEAFDAEDDAAEENQGVLLRQHDCVPGSVC